MHTPRRLIPVTGWLLSINARQVCIVRASTSSSSTARKWTKPRMSDRFGNLSQQTIQMIRLRTHNNNQHNPSDRIIEDKWEHFNFKQEVPVIDRPIWGPGKRRRTSESIDKFLDAQGVDLRSARVVIECTRKEYNHYEGMRYPTLAESLPLFSQYWYNNKHADEWFIIHRTQAIHVTNEDISDRSWEEFIDLIHPQIFRNITAMKFRAPTKVQHDFFRAYPTTKHAFMAAETGSGKTLAYGAPILSKLLFLKEKQPNAKAVVLTPSTHLKGQTLQKLQQLSENTSLKVIAPEKGNKYTPDDFDVLVSTPGMAYNVLKRLDSSAASVKFLIMDESDMMLDDSFQKEITDLLSVIPVRHSRTAPGLEDGAQIIFSSATCPLDLTELVNEIVDDSHILYITSNHLHKVLPNVEQKFIRVREKDKVQRTVDIVTEVTKSKKNKVLIFCKDSGTALFLSSELNNQHGFSSLLLSRKRKDSFNMLEEEASRILVSTDISGEN